MDDDNVSMATSNADVSVLNVGAVNLSAGSSHAATTRAASQNAALLTGLRAQGVGMLYLHYTLVLRLKSC
jgi:hypothetical protein